jgi:hypothetical protein
MTMTTPLYSQELRQEMTIEQRVEAMEATVELLETEVEVCRAWRETNRLTIEALTKRIEQYERRKDAGL